MIVQALLGPARRDRFGVQAFTLIELLVVISVIGLLIAILLPALQAARESAVGIVCLSNLRQVGMATEMYADENDGYAPHWDATAAPWAPLLIGAGYISEMQATFCPDDDALHRENSPWDVYGISESVYVGSGPERLQSISGPSQFLLYGDTVRSDVMRQWCIMYMNAYATSAFRVHARHSGSANILYADSHASPRTQSDLKEAVAVYPQ